MSSLNLIEKFCEMLLAEKNSSLNTVEAYSRDLRNFYTQNGNIDLIAVNSEQIRAYLKSLKEDSYASKTIARHLSSLKQFYTFLLSEKIISENPTREIEAPKLGKSLPKVLTEEEVRVLLRSTEEGETPDLVRLRAILEILYATGLRVSELVTLPLKAFSKTESGVTLLRIKGKGRKERIVPLGIKASDAVKDYLEIRGHFCPSLSPWMFPSNSKEGHLTRQRLGQLLKLLSSKAGIDPEKVSPHVLRHAFATHLLNHGADLMSVQRLLGHESITTTEIYTHIASDRLKEIVNTCHPLAKEGKYESKLKES